MEGRALLGSCVLATGVLGACGRAPESSPAREDEHAHAAGEEAHAERPAHRSQRLFPLSVPGRWEVRIGGRPEGVLLSDGVEAGATTIIATHRSGAQPASAVALDAAGQELWRTACGDWPLRPLEVRTRGGSSLAIASRATPSLAWLDPVTGEERHRVPLPSSPRFIAAGPLHGPDDGRAALLLSTGALWLADPEGHLEDTGLVFEEATLVEVEPAMIVVGSMARAGDRDALVRLFQQPDGNWSPAPTESIDGLPRDWLVTQTTEWLAAGDDALLRLEGQQWRRGPEAGRAPLRLQALEGSRFACLSKDLTLRVFDGAALLSSTYAGQDAWDVALADLDGDGFRDAVVANRDAERISLLFGAPAGWCLSQRREVPAGPIALARGPQGTVGLVSALTNHLSLEVPGEESLQTLSEDAGRDADQLLHEDASGDWILRGPGFIRRVAPDGSVTQQPVGRASGPLCQLEGRTLALDEALDSAFWLSRTGDAQAVGLPAPGRAALALEDGAWIALDGPRFAHLRPGESAAPLVALENTAPLSQWPIPLGIARLDGPESQRVVLLLRDARAPEPPGRIAVLERRSGKDEWRVVQIEETGLRPHGITTADLDGDGWDEVLVTCQNSHHLNVWKGGERLGRAHDLGAGRGPLDLCTEADGRSVVVAANFSNELLRFGEQ